MEEEWPEKVKKHGEKVFVVKMHQFWGPVHMLVPTSCSEASNWDATLAEDQRQALGITTTAPPHTLVRKMVDGAPDTKPAAKSRGRNKEADDEKSEAKGEPASRDEEEDGHEDGDTEEGEATKKKQKGTKSEVDDSEAEKRRKETEDAGRKESSKREKKKKKKAGKAAEKEVGKTKKNKDEKATEKDAEKTHEKKKLEKSTEEDAEETEKRETEKAPKKAAKKTEKQKDEAEEEEAHGEIADDTPEKKHDDDEAASSEEERRLLNHRLRSDRSALSEAEARRLKLIIPLHIHNVSVCKGGHELLRDFDGPTRWNRYFSMISLSSLVTGGTTSMESLHHSRKMTYRCMFAGLMITMFMKYSLKLIDIASSAIGHKYVQLWNGGRTTIDKMLESIMIHGVSIIFTLAMQLTLCTLFLTFWQGEYFVMSYIPGIGFVMFFVSFVSFTIMMVVDRVRQTMLNSSDSYIYCFWILWTIWLFVVAVPMLGYCIYVMQFAMQVIAGNWLHKEPFSPEFVHASKVVCHAAGLFTGVAICELLVILKLDLEEGKTRTSY